MGRFTAMESLSCMHTITSQKGYFQIDDYDRHSLLYCHLNHNLGLNKSGTDRHTQTTLGGATVSQTVMLLPSLQQIVCV